MKNSKFCQVKGNSVKSQSQSDDVAEYQNKNIMVRVHSQKLPQLPGKLKLNIKDHRAEDYRQQLYDQSSHNHRNDYRQSCQSRKERQIETLMDENRQLKLDSNRMKQLIEEYQLNNQRLVEESESNIRKFEKYIEQMNGDREQKDSQLEELNKELVKMEKVLDHYKDTINQKSSYVQSLESENAKLKSRNIILEAETNTVKNALKKTQQQYQKKLQDTWSTSTQQQTNNQELQGKLRKQTKELGQKDAQIEKLKEQMERIKQQLQGLKGKGLEAKEREIQLKNLIQEKEVSILKMAQCNSQLSQKILNLDKIAQPKENNKELRACIQNMQKQIADMHSGKIQQSKLIEQNAYLKNMIQSVKQEKRVLISISEGLKQDLKENQYYLNCMDARLREIQSKYRELENKNRDLENRNQGLSSRNETLRCKIKELEAILQDGNRCHSNSVHDFYQVKVKELIKQKDNRIISLDNENQQFKKQLTETKAELTNLKYENDKENKCRKNHLHDQPISSNKDGIYNLLLEQQERCHRLETRILQNQGRHGSPRNTFTEGYIHKPEEYYSHRAQIYNSPRAQRYDTNRQESYRIQYRNRRFHDRG